MLLNHVAAILFFSGPLLYLGLWMLIDPAGIANLPALIIPALGNRLKALAGVPSQPALSQTDPSIVARKMRTGVRIVGLGLVLFAIVI